MILISCRATTRMKQSLSDWYAQSPLMLTKNQFPESMEGKHIEVNQTCYTSTLEWEWFNNDVFALGENWGVFLTCSFWGSWAKWFKVPASAEKATGISTHFLLSVIPSQWQTSSGFRSVCGYIHVVKGKTKSPWRSWNKVTVGRIPLHP